MSKQMMSGVMCTRSQSHATVVLRAAELYTPKGPKGVKVFAEQIGAPLLVSSLQGAGNNLAERFLWRSQLPAPSS